MATFSTWVKPTFSTWVKPSMLFAAGSMASAADAAVFSVNYTATDPATDITIGSSAAGPQYSFQSATIDFGFIDPSLGVKPTAILNANGTATISESPMSSPYYPAPGENLGNQSAKTQGISSGGDGYYGITFDTDDGAQTGYFSVVDGGTRINEIGYEAAAAVPEPDAWALMIVGLGGAGLALRRQRRQQRQLAALATS